jgi:nucleoredoxin
VQEISLMLRSGYTIKAVESEAAARHFVGTVDPEAEKALLQYGATPAFLLALETGVYAIPAVELAAVQNELEAKARRRAQEVEEAKKFDTLYQDQLARSRAAAPAAVSGTNAIAALVKGDLVTSNNGTLSVYNDQPLERKKLIGLYFSAHWCGPCRKFTPELVAYYNRIVATHPEFEIVFVSNDRTGAAMETYMRETHMPWPAVSYDKIKGKAELMKYAGSSIPCLVVVDAQGKVVSDSFAGKQYVGPHKVLTELDQLFASGSTVAQSR